MSKLMLILGIVVTAAAIALGLLVFFSPGEMQIRGLTHEVVAILLVGGLAFIGMGGIIGAVERSVEATVELRRLLGGPLSGRNRAFRHTDCGSICGLLVAALSQTPS